MLAHVIKNVLGIGAGLMVLIVAAIVFAWPVVAQSAPPTPENLRVIDKTHRSVTLGWDDPGDASIVGYRILRRQIPIMAPGYFKEIEDNTNSTSTEYTDTEDYLEPNIRYVYRIQSVNASGDLSGQSNYVRVRVPRWQAPQNLSAEVVDQDDGSYDIKLIWDDERPINGIAWVSGFRISRRITAPWVEEEFTELTEIRGWRGGYTDSGVNWPREYEYKVEARSKNAYGLPGTIEAEVGEAVTVSEPSGGDFPEDPASRGYVAVDGDPATGEIARGDPWDGVSDPSGNEDLDYFRTDLVAGQSYRIDVKGDVESDYGGTLTNPGVVLLRLNEKLEVQYLLPKSPHVEVTGAGTQWDHIGIWDNNSGEGKNARLEITVHTTGTYIVRVSDSDPEENGGTYTVTVARTDD